MSSARHEKLLFALETAHIPLWLIKDVCWLMDFKTYGVIMAVPTILVAILMTFMTYRDQNRFLPNVSIACWIIANANWMFDEFFALHTKHYSIYPFVIGILVFIVFLIQKLTNKTKDIKQN